MSACLSMLSQYAVFSSDSLINLDRLQITDVHSSCVSLFGDLTCPPWSWKPLHLTLLLLSRIEFRFATPANLTCLAFSIWSKSFRMIRLFLIMTFSTARSFILFPDLLPTSCLLWMFPHLRRDVSFALHLICVGNLSIFITEMSVAGSVPNSHMAAEIRALSHLTAKRNLLTLLFLGLLLMGNVPRAWPVSFL